MTNSHVRMIGKTAAERLANNQSPPKKSLRFQRPIRRDPSAVLRLASPPLGAFAGSKWGDSPAPNALPRPPTHWTRMEPDVSRGLKMLLNVQA